MIRRICVVSSSRADYGLLKLLLSKIKSEQKFTLQLVVTGSHLEKKYGETYKEINQDGNNIDKKVKISMKKNDVIGVSAALGDCIGKFARVFDELEPDLLLILGDRFEIFAAAVSAHIGGIPIAHIHGGELTEGAIDDAFRHSITKMSKLHFVSTQEYAKRVIQLGETADRVFVVGALGIDAINNLKLLTKEEIETKLDLKLGLKNLLITFHPVTLEVETAKKQIKVVLEALQELTDTTLIFTAPNADPESDFIYEAIAEFITKNQNAKLYESLGQLLYFSLIPFMDGVVGNSSSGIIEVPIFNVGTVNIGNRQKGRLHGSTVINCQPNRGDILQAIQKLYSPSFKVELQKAVHPYGITDSSGLIVNILRTIDLSLLGTKVFKDLEFDRN